MTSYLPPAILDTALDIVGKKAHLDLERSDGLVLLAAYAAGTDVIGPHAISERLGRNVDGVRDAFKRLAAAGLIEEGAAIDKGRAIKVYTLPEPTFESTPIAGFTHLAVGAPYDAEQDALPDAEG
jgi:hypothetical protein